jgi:hypothetical protein
MADEEVKAGEPQDQAGAVAGAVAGAEELEARARRMGWRPQEEFRGDPNRWTDAKSFIERGEAELPIIRERYRALDDRFARMENEFGATRQQLQDVTYRAHEMQGILGEFRDRAKRAEEVAYARARTELESRMEAAMEQADKSGYNRAKGELDALNRAERDSVAPPPRPPAAPQFDPNMAPGGQQPPPMDPTVMRWVEENPWFRLDRTMAGYATAKFMEVQQARPGLGTQDHLDAVRTDVMQRFPEKFENPKRAAAAAVASSSPPAGSAKQKGPPPFEQWPEDARKGYLSAKKYMPDYKPEEYAKMYFTE